MFEMTNYMVRAISDGIEGYGAIFYAVEGDNEADIDSRIKEISKFAKSMVQNMEMKRWTILR